MKGVFCLIVFGLLVVPVVPLASAVADENLDTPSVAETNPDIQALIDRVEKLEEEQKEAQKRETPSWLDKLTFKGDFRYRYEWIDDDRKSNKRARHRIRARIFMGAKIHDMMDMGFGLVTGSDNPVSGNQTLGDGWSSKGIQLDLAYFDFHPMKAGNDAVELDFIGGKMKKPWYRVGNKSELMWDSDLRPEGLVAKFGHDRDTFGIFGNIGGYQVDEHKNGANSKMWGGQIGANVELSPEMGGLIFGAGYYDWVAIEGRTVFYDPEDSNGNSSTTQPDGTETYDSDFTNVELFVQYDLPIRELPVGVFANWVENTRADDYDTGYLVGFEAGKAKQAWDWYFRYQWKVIQKDSVVGIFTDSDFGGGGTDSKGHEFNAGLVLAKNCQLCLSYFLNETGIAAKNNDDFKRLMIDLKVKF